ncbi:MAG: hypothetical protein OXI96_08190 [Acidimicrobiaceae bacterium]|nr:hypothetical protein [Acidimicrobiaceae bacterium]
MTAASTRPTPSDGRIPAQSGSRSTRRGDHHDLPGTDAKLSAVVTKLSTTEATAQAYNLTP